MKNILVALLFVAPFFFTSCQKEVSIEDGDVVNATDSLLQKVVAKAGDDSVIYQYTYNAARKLVTHTNTFLYQNVPYDDQWVLQRNAQGVIQRAVHKGSLLSLFGIDSVPFKVNYDAARLRYTSKVAIYPVNGLDIKDSTAYTYNNSGKIIKEEQFLGYAAIGGYGESSKTEYTYYGNGSLQNSKTSTYDVTTSTYELETEKTYEYDQQVNPLKLGLEAFIIEIPLAAIAIIDNPIGVSEYNIIKVTTVDHQQSADSEEVTNTYVYNDKNKPSTAMRTFQSSGYSLPIRYYYQ